MVDQRYDINKGSNNQVVIVSFSCMMNLLTPIMMIGWNIFFNLLNRGLIDNIFFYIDTSMRHVVLELTFLLDVEILPKRKKRKCQWLLNLPYFCYLLMDEIFIFRSQI